jgi:hypothetical protein
MLCSVILLFYNRYRYFFVALEARDRRRVRVTPVVTARFRSCGIFSEFPSQPIIIITAATT